MSATSLDIPLRPAVPLPAVATKTSRLESIDLLRGAVMIVMALDHVREFIHKTAFFVDPLDLQHTSVALFFTRWVTHFCAPVFVFLAGVSACLYGARRGPRELAAFLCTRGLWLIVLEVFVITLTRTFNVEYEFFNLQVIWVIGVSMIVLAGLVQLDRRWVLCFGLGVIAGHNLLDGTHVPGTGAAAFAWALLHEPGYFTFGPVSIRVLYPLLPWVGVMATGYGFGHLFAPDHDPAARRGTLLRLGAAMIGAFVLLRYFNLYGQSVPWSPQSSPAFSVLSFLSVTKYPPSLLYLLIMLGPAFIFLALAEKPLNAWTARIAVFGRVPMFYYLIHLPLIHLLAMLAAVASGYPASTMVLTSLRTSAVPALEGFGFDLPVVWIVWAAIVVALYPACKWYDEYKRKYGAQKWWLSYL